MNTAERSRFPGGLGIGQRWHNRRQTSEVCRVVGIDPTMHVVEVEDQSGEFERDTIEHFLSTHDEDAEAC